MCSMIHPYGLRRPYSNMLIEVPRWSSEKVSNPGCFLAFSHTDRIVVWSNGSPESVVFGIRMLFGSSCWFGTIGHSGHAKPGERGKSNHNLGSVPEEV